MPQMSPIYWLILMMYFIIMMLILIMIIYFFFKPVPMMNFSLTKLSNTMYWMW